MNSKILIMLLMVQLFVACGGGGSSSTTVEAKATLDPTKNDIDVFDKNRSIGHISVTPREVEESLCFSDIPSFRDLNEIYYKKSIQAPVQDFNFSYVLSENEFGVSESGFDFIAQNKEVYDILSSLLFIEKGRNPDTGSPEIKINNKKDVYGQIRGFCKDIQCAADSVFQDSWGLRFLFKDKFGILLSGYASQETEEYSDDQYLMSAAQAVLSLPSGTFPLNQDNFSDPEKDIMAHNVIISPYATNNVNSANFGRAAAITFSSRKGYSSKEDSMVSYVDVYMLEPWKTDRSFFSRIGTVFHELIHVMDQTKEGSKVLSISPEWLKLSSWKQDPQTKAWKMGKPKVACSEYGSTNPAEDFAECGTMYRYAPRKLKSLSKAKYNFLKKRVFKNVEYHTLSKCQKSVVTF